MFTDEQWAALEPLVEAARPKGKTRPRDLRRTLEAIVWRHRNGATWRAIPAEPRPLVAGRPAVHPLGGAGRVAAAARDGARARGRARHGVPRRDQHQGAPQGRGRAQKGGTGAQRDRREALGRSRGGFGTKACVVADGRGRAVAFALAPGQAHELPLAPGLLDRLPRVPLWVVGDRGYSSDAFRDLVWGKGARPALPTRSNEAAVACPDYIYNNAAWSSGSGAGSGRPGRPHPTKDRGQLPRRPLRRRHHGLAQALTGPSERARDALDERWCGGQLDRAALRQVRQAAGRMVERHLDRELGGAMPAAVRELAAAGGLEDAAVEEVEASARSARRLALAGSRLGLAPSAEELLDPYLDGVRAALVGGPVLEGRDADNAGADGPAPGGRDPLRARARRAVLPRGHRSLGRALKS